MIKFLRWAQSEQVNNSLVQATHSADETVRRAAVEALGWRLRKRSADAQALIPQLTHRDALTQFLAAEGLARAGHADGMNILLSAVELMPEFSLRVRAVEALGELADPRALDLLLKIAMEEDHALQETAVIAIGHLGQSPQAETIFKLLKRLANGNAYSLATGALHGLRWFNTLDSWGCDTRLCAAG